MAERLAVMPRRVEAEFLVQLGELAAEHRHLLDRRLQGLAGPEAGMDADAGDLAALAQRDDDQVQRHAAVHRRAQVGLGDQGLLPAFLEIADRALAAALVGRLARLAHDAKPLRGHHAGTLDLIAEQGHRPVGQPVQQGAALRIAHTVGLGMHVRLHHPPVGDRGAHVLEHALKLGLKLLPALRIGPVDLDIDDRFPPAAVLAERLDVDEAALVVPGHADHGVEKAMDDQPARRDRLGDGIDEEGHIVIDDADPHPPLAEPCAGRFQPDQSRTRLPLAGAGGDEGGRLAGFLRAVIVELSGKRALAQEGGKNVQQALVSGGPRYLGFHTNPLPETRSDDGACPPCAAYSPGPERPSTPGGRDRSLRRPRQAEPSYSTVIVPVIPKAVCIVWVQRSR